MSAIVISFQPVSELDSGKNLRDSNFDVSCIDRNIIDCALFDWNIGLKKLNSNFIVLSIIF